MSIHPKGTLNWPWLALDPWNPNNDLKKMPFYLGSILQSWDILRHPTSSGSRACFAPPQSTSRRRSNVEGGQRPWDGRYASLYDGQDLIPWGTSDLVREIWWEQTKNMIFMLFAKWRGCIDICTVHFSDWRSSMRATLLVPSCRACRRCCRRFHGFLQKHFQVATLVSWAWAYLGMLEVLPGQTILQTPSLHCWLNIWKWEQYRFMSHVIQAVSSKSHGYVTG